jgi:uncharacterized protein (TIGR03437 family)
MNTNTLNKRELSRAAFAPLISITILFFPALCRAQASQAPTIAQVQNAEGGSATIAPNTWVAIMGSNLAPAGDTRIWQGSDFVNGQMPTQLDGVGVSMNGENAYVYYISPAQVNVLTPSDLAPGAVQVKVTSGGVTSASFTAEAQAYSPSFFIFGAGPYLVATHANGTLLGPTSLYPGLSTPAAPGEIVILYANGFGPVSPAVVPGSEVQSGSLPSFPVIDIGGLPASVQFAGLVSPGLYQFNVVVPVSAPNGDNMLTAQYSGLSVQSGVLLTVQNPNSAPQLESLSLSASQAASGSSVQGTVFLTLPAGSAGVTIALSSNSTVASVPSSVTIPAGSTSASFTVSAGSVSSNQAVTITAAYNGSSAQTMLTVTPAAVAAFSSLLSTVTFQPTGNPSSQFTLQVTPQAGNATYTATIEGVPFFVNGTSSNQNQTFTFTTLYSSAVTTSPAFSFNGSLLRVSSASLSFTLTVNPAESGGGTANGSLSGTFSVTGTSVLGGSAVTASGVIGGNYTAAQ